MSRDRLTLAMVVVSLLQMMIFGYGISTTCATSTRASWT